MERLWNYVKKVKGRIMGIWGYLKSDEEGIVGVWDTITKLLIKISILELIIACWGKIISKWEQERKEKSQKVRYLFIDTWVCCHTFIAIGGSLIIFHYLNSESRLSILMICIYGCWRVFEIIIKQIRVILFDTIGKHAGKIKSARRSIILLIHNIAEMIFWFACTHMGIVLLGMPRNEHLKDLYTWQEFIKCSTLKMLVFGDDYSGLDQLMETQSSLLNITFWEIIIGFIVIVVSLARLFSLLPTNIMQDTDEQSTN